MSNKDKKSFELGFSLVELIVVIAIVAAMAGVLVPAFGMYLTRYRARSCMANREAIAGVVEKCVYEGSIYLSEGSTIPGEASPGGEDDDTTGAPAVQSLVNGTQPNVNVDTQYISQITQHRVCTASSNQKNPDYSVRITKNTAAADTDAVYTVLIQCECHKDYPVIVDITGWNKDVADSGDPAVKQPGVTPIGGGGDPVPPGITPEVTHSKLPTPSSWWPYLDDERWDGKRYPGQYVEVDAGTLFSDDGVRYAIVDKTDGPWTGKGKFQIYYMWSSGPSYIDSTQDCWYVITELSGVEWTLDTLEFEGNNKDSTITPIGVGDILFIGDYVFVYNGRWNTGSDKTWIQVPSYDGNGVPWNFYGEWYCVGHRADYDSL